MFMYALSLIMAFSFIFIPFIAIIKSSVTLSNFLIFTGYIGKTLKKKRLNIKRKVINKTTYLRISFLMQFLLGFLLTLLSLILFTKNTNSYFNILIIFCVSLFGSIIIGTNLNKYLVTN
ncbi:hypothetical protein ACED96_05000 [Clostridium thermobutyricum]|uniref:hypothetical protein n=1 Tax=Clostridium thermobutyricum TaxID=29372 RepID=UPI0018AA7A09|nr:hypothetical protein [Clostridium thermobutyricum]